MNEYPSFTYEGSFAVYPPPGERFSLKDPLLPPQGENASRQRIKKLELVIAGLREKLAGMVISEEKMAEKGARADAKAMLAEKGEQELRSAVRAIKYDFEVNISISTERFVLKTIDVPAVGVDA